jgi:uncharacterized protein (TIGR03435 family)
MDSVGWILFSVLLVQAAPQKPSFDVASVKLNTTGRNASAADQPGGRFVASQIPLRQLIQFAYRGNQQFIGGPDWLDRDRWDIEAKAAEGSVSLRSHAFDLTEPDTVALMVQSLLEDRFKLKVHQETREVALYELTVAKGGTKLKLSADQTPPPAFVGGGGPARGGALPRGGINISGNGFEAQSQSMAMLATVLSTVYAGRPVIDKTGLKGLYDMKLEWNRDAGLIAPTGPGTISSASGPSLITAVEDQLGLKLESAKGRLPVLVIDSVQRPIEN